MKRRQESERRSRGEYAESKKRGGGGEEKERERVTMKAFQQTSTSIMLAVAKAGISSGCTTAEVSGLKCVFDPQSSGPCRRLPRSKHTPRRESYAVLWTERQHGLQPTARESPQRPHGQER